MVIIDSFMLFLLIVIEINIVADRNGTDKMCYETFRRLRRSIKYYMEHYRRFLLVIQTHMVYKCDNAPISLYHATYRQLSEAKLGIFFLCSADVTAADRTATIFETVFSTLFEMLKAF